MKREGEELVSAYMRGEANVAALASPGPVAHHVLHLALKVYINGYGLPLATCLVTQERESVCVEPRTCLVTQVSPLMSRDAGHW